MSQHNVGEIVRFKNNSLAQIIKRRKTGRKALIFISSKNASNLTNLIYNQRMKYLNWPKRKDKNFKSKIKEIFEQLNYSKPSNNFYNQDACNAN